MEHEASIFFYPHMVLSDFVGKFQYRINLQDSCSGTKVDNTGIKCKHTGVTHINLTGFFIL